MTRTVAVGEPTEEMRQVYDAVLRAQLAGSPGPGPGYPAAKSITLPGRCSGRRATATILATASVTGWDWKSTKSQRQFVQCGAAASGSGDFGGAGVYLPGRFGVRIEDVLWLTNEGRVDLTQSPKKLIVL